MSVQLDDYPLLLQGKIRSIYEIDSEYLLCVASDKVSAFDHVLTPEIPGKGKILTAVTVFFLRRLRVEHHLAGSLDDPRIPDQVYGRAMIVRRLRMIPLECVVRGYLTGAALAEYRTSRSICGIVLPEGLQEASALPEPIFTPALKAAPGEHDENVDFATVQKIFGADLAEQLRDKALDIYQRGAAIANRRGLILADTKFEFGLDSGNNIILADEVLTPDSSRYWSAQYYEVGCAQESFDKQIVRNWLRDESRWDIHSTIKPPKLPQEIVELTRAKYSEFYKRITGESFDGFGD